MDEKKEVESTPEDTTEGTEQQTTGLIDRASAAAERLEKANKKQEELLNRQETLAAKQALAGKAEAGSTTEKPKELTPEEYAQGVQDGTIDPFKAS